MKKITTRERAEILACNTAHNAMNIAREMPDEFGKTFLANHSATSWQLNRIADAAMILARVETAPGFTWEQQINDYETACAYLAKLCASNRAINPVSVVATITG